MRIIFFIIGCLSVFAFPWWVTSLIIAATAIRYRAWEVLLLGGFLDALYLSPSMYHGLPLFTLSTLAVLWAFEPLRQRFL